MMTAGIEIGIIANRRRDMKGHVLHRQKTGSNPCLKGRIGKHLENTASKALPRRRAPTHQAIQLAIEKRFGWEFGNLPRAMQFPQIENLVSDGRAGPRFAVARAEYP